MWPRLINIAVGIWVMAAPAVLDFDSVRAENNDHITGPLIVTFAAIALCEVTRPCRWIAFLCGAWLLMAPFLLGYWASEPPAAISDILSGGVSLVLSLFPGRIKSRFGGGWSALWR